MVMSYPGHAEIIRSAVDASETFRLMALLVWRLSTKWNKSHRTWNSKGECTRVPNFPFLHDDARAPFRTNIRSCTGVFWPFLQRVSPNFSQIFHMLSFYERLQDATFAPFTSCLRYCKNKYTLFKIPSEAKDLVVLRTMMFILFFLWKLFWVI